MRRAVLAAAAAVCAAGAYPAVAGATHSNGRGPGYDKVNGTGFSPTYRYIHVNARERDTPEGRFFVAEDEDTVAHGIVTCLNVFENRALVGGIVTQSTDPLHPPGSDVVVGVVDNEEPGHEGDRNFRLEPADDQQCNDNGVLNQALVIFSAPIVEGNYIVHDHQP